MLVKSFIQQSIHFIKQSVQQNLFPASCLLCGNIIHHSATANICRDCQANLPILPHHCQQCAQFLPQSSRKISACKTCRETSPPFMRTFALFPYEFPIPALIHELKFNHRLSHAKLFGDFLSSAIPRWYNGKNKPDCMIPVPLHPIRLRERGFNQVREIIRGLDTETGIPIDAHGTARRRHTRAQSGLSASQRQANLMNAFSIKRRYNGMHIAIVDDVVTTGQTTAAFSSALKQQGAARIDIWCCARA